MIRKYHFGSSYRLPNILKEEEDFFLNEQWKMYLEYFNSKLNVPNPIIRECFIKELKNVYFCPIKKLSYILIYEKALITAKEFWPGQFKEFAKRYMLQMPE